MPDLLVIIPTRGRPHTVAEVVDAFRDTCRADTGLMFVIDDDDPAAERYQKAVNEQDLQGSGVDTAVFSGRRIPLPRRIAGIILGTQPAPGTMVSALNYGAQYAAQGDNAPAAVAFMGDDHRPRTVGWDRAYLNALHGLPGIVYGNDLVQGASLPTQFAVTTDVVRALGFMSPPVLTHLYLDNYWLTIGQASGCITYLPDVVVEHLHPVAGTAEWDEGYRRVNAPAMYSADRHAYEQYMAAHRDRDVLAVRSVRVAAR